MQFLFTKTPLLFFVQNLWRDEAYSVLLSQLSLLDIAKHTAGDFSPPLYYFVLKLWISLFGSYEVSVRALSALFFIITLFTMFELLVLMLKVPIKRAIVYLLFFISNPFLISYAFEARMYMMTACFVTLSYFFLWKKSWLWYVAAMTFALYTHYFAILIFICQFALTLSRRSKPLTLFKEGLPIVLLAPWILFVIAIHPSSDGSFWILKPELTEWWHLPFTLYTGYEPINAQYFHPGILYPSFHQFLLFSIYFLLGGGLYVLTRPIFFQLKHHTKVSNKIMQTLLHSKYSILVCWAFVPPIMLLIISNMWQPVFLPRYFIFSVPGFLILLAVLFERLWQMSIKSTMQKSALVTGGVMFFLLTLNYHSLNLLYHSKREVRPMYLRIISAMKPRDFVYVTDVLDFHLAQYYLPRNTKVRMYQKTYQDTPQYVGKVLIPRSVFTQTLPAFPARAFVVYYDWFNIRSMM